MDGIKVGVTLMQDFCRPNTDTYKGYIDYLDRNEAQRNDAIQTFNLFNDYMGNPEKSTGLFTKDKDTLTYEEKRDVKAIFETAQKNGSIMWQTVISFDNRWLEKNALYDSTRGLIDESKLKEVTRLAINRLLKSEGLEHAVWSAGIHYNTDNIHVHVATVEPYPMRKTMIYQGNEEVRGKFRLKNLEACKSSVVNEIMQTREVNLKINYIIREELVRSIKECELAEDPSIRKLFLDLYEVLPNVSGNLLHYNNSIMQPQRKVIDEISHICINKYHSEEYKEFSTLLDKQSGLYAEAFGTSQREYKQSKERDLLERMGNAVLEAVKKYEDSLNFKQEKYEKKIEGSFSTAHLPEPVVSKREIFVGEEKGETECCGSEYSLELIAVEKKTTWSQKVQKELQEMEDFWESTSAEVIQRQEPGATKDKIYEQYFSEWKEIRNLLNPKEGERMDREKLLDLLKLGEEKRNPFILHQIGELHLNGRILETSGEIAQGYFGKAVELFCNDLPYLEAPEEDERRFNFKSYIQYRIGKQYNRGWGVEKDSSEAAIYFEESGESYARYSLANLYFYGDGVGQDYKQAFSLYSSVEQFPFADLKKGLMHEEGLGTEKDIVKSEACYAQAFQGFLKMETERPDELAEYQLGKMLYYGQGTEKNLEEAIKYLELSAEKKNVPEQFLVSKIYIDQQMAEKIPGAVEVLRDIADHADHSGAQYALGKLFTDRESGYYDLKTGVYYLEKASEHDNEYAQYRLGCLYVDPQLEIYDLGKGIENFEKAAWRGSEYAGYRLGKIYLTKGTEEYDLLRGIGYLKSAMEKGYEPAQYALACELLDKESKAYSKEDGLRYLKEFAENGHEFAQVKMGFEYLKGDNVQRNIYMAGHWFEKAASQGNGLAKEMLVDLSAPPKRPVRSGMGELDKALIILRRTMQREEMEALRNLKEYEIRQEQEISYLEL